MTISILTCTRKRKGSEGAVKRKSDSADNLNDRGIFQPEELADFPIEEDDPNMCFICIVFSLSASPLLAWGELTLSYNSGVLFVSYFILYSAATRAMANVCSALSERRSSTNSA